MYILTADKYRKEILPLSLPPFFLPSPQGRSLVNGDCTDRPVGLCRMIPKSLSSASATSRNAVHVVCV